MRVRAVVLAAFGAPGNLAVAEVPDPAPEPGQVLVEVQLANITFVETQVRAGSPPNPAMLPKLPAVLGNGVGGVVVSAGAGVAQALVGQRVITATGGSGGYAERAVADAAGLVAVPEELSMADAVALLADGRTAVGLVRAAGLRAGDTVLIEAAAGGVGSLLVQLAHNSGARVVAVAGGQRKVSVARQLGADIAVDYTVPGWDGQVRTEARVIDVVFDGVGGQAGQAALGLLRDGGRFCAYGMASGSFTEIPGEQTARRGIAVIRGAPASPSQMRELSTAAIAQVSSGKLKPLIGQTFPLERAADAHAAIEARATVGKTLLLVRGTAAWAAAEDAQ
jgi:NADPH:quinone reductase